MQDKIFISYRRSDSAGHAGRLYDSLQTYFGPDRVFMDIDRIKGGDNFVRAIDSALDSTGAVLVVIGKDWLTTNDEKGRRRLDDSGDFVRLEIATALSKKLVLIPVLVQGARMPTEEVLPPELKELAHTNAVLATDERWGSDTRRLAKILELDVAGSKSERKFNNLKAAILGLLFASVFMSVLLEIYAQGVAVAFTRWGPLRYLNIFSMLAVSILLPILAGFAEESSRKSVWITLACAPFSAFLLAINLGAWSIIPNTLILVILNMSRFNPR